MDEISEPQSLPIETGQIPTELNLTRQWSSKVDQLVQDKLVNLQQFSSNKLEQITNAARDAGDITKFAARATVLAGGMTLFAACGGAAEAIPTPTVPMATRVIQVQSGVDTTSPSDTVIVSAATVTPEVFPTPTIDVSAPETATAKPDATQVAQPSEQEVAQVVNVGGYIESDKENPSYESVTLLLPEGIVDGESPIIPKDGLMSLSFNLDSGTLITKLKFPLSEWLGTKFAAADIESDATPASVNVAMTEYIQNLLHNAQLNGITIQNPELLNKIAVLHGQLPDGTMRIVFHMPNEYLTYIDNQGSHILNIAEEFTQHATFGIGRRGDVAPGTALGPIDLTLKEGMINGGSQEIKIPDVTLNTLQARTVSSPSSQTSESGVQPQRVIETPGTQSSLPEQQQENRWIKEWQPNEKVSLQDWWQDMVLKGYIHVDSVAQQYGGDQLNFFLNGTHLVPNPQDYYKEGLPFVGNCKSQLDYIVEVSQGHITISSEAYSNIPGDPDCQVYANK